jgi:hypothetical protein
MVTGTKKIRRASRPNAAAPIGRRKPRIWIRTDAELTVITISGEIDASDIDDMSPYARRLMRDCDVLKIDLNGIDFIAAEALRALFTLWSPDPAATEPPRVHVVRIHFEHMTVVVRRGG